jgi:hypothetical protein
MNINYEKIVGVLPLGLILINIETWPDLYVIGKIPLPLPLTNEKKFSFESIFTQYQDKKEIFKTWLQVAARLYKSQSWDKISALIPLKEVDIKNGENLIKYKIISYPICNDTNNISQIILEFKQVFTEIKQVEECSTNNLQSREVEVKAILSIINTPSDELMQLMNDSKERLENIGSNLHELEDYITLKEITIITKIKLLPVQLHLQ